MFWDHFVFEYSREWLRRYGGLLLSACESDMLERREAAEIVEEVRAAIKDWRATCPQDSPPRGQL